MEAENKIITIKATVKPASRSRHPRIFMGIIGVNPPIEMFVLGSRFQAGDNNSIIAEALE